MQKTRVPELMDDLWGSLSEKLEGVPRVFTTNVDASGFHEFVGARPEKADVSTSDDGTQCDIRDDAGLPESDLGQVSVRSEHMVGRFCRRKRQS
jgi:hypothetical protein